MSSEQMTANATKRARLSRDARKAQLVELARRIIYADGADALTLGHLAERAGVTKPVIYSHFGNRAALLITLFREFDAQQTILMDTSLENCPATLTDRAHIIASSYVDCVLSQGRELPGVVAALEGAPEMKRIKDDFYDEFMAKCRKLLTPFSAKGDISQAGLWAMIGSAQSLSEAAATDRLSAEQAIAELDRVIQAMVLAENI